MSFPVADLTAFRAGGASTQAEADSTVAALVKYGCMLVKTDVLESDNQAFLDMMEDYFAQPEELLLNDARPEYGYQNTEKPRCSADADGRCKALIAQLEPSERPLDMLAEHVDPKARFFHKLGDAPPDTKFERLNAPNVVPKAFEDVWATRMNRWGAQMRDSVEGVAEMLAVGLGLPQNAFTHPGKYGSHLLAPTATDLRKYGKLGEVYAGWHSDLGFLTIHGRSRYPGLSVWGRNTGKRIEVKVPPGHLLVQAGMQLEHVTGGLILAGFHEVACTPATIEAIIRAKVERPGRPLIRISSTMFWHLSSDYVMKPFEDLRLPEGMVRPQLPDASKYPPITVGRQMEAELQHIKLMSA